MARIQKSKLFLSIPNSFPKASSLENKCIKLENDLRVLKECIGKVTKTTNMTLKPEEVPDNAHQLSLSSSRVLIFSDRIFAETIQTDKSLKWLYSLHLCIYLANFYAFIPSSAHHISRLNSNFVTPVSFCMFFCGAFLSSCAARNVNLKGYFLITVLTLFAGCGNLIIAHSLAHYHKNLFVFGL